MSQSAYGMEPGILAPGGGSEDVYPGGIDPNSAIGDMGGLEGVTEGGLGFVGGWGGGHA